MRLVENETRLTMNKRRNFVNYADMTLSDGTVLHLTPSDFRISGQSFTDDWVDGEAFQIGTTIGKTATLLLDNTDGRTEEIEGEIVTYLHGKFSEYDFYMAYFVLYVCLPEAYHYEGELRDQMIRIGTFTVTTPTAHGSTIEITGVDNMYMFDKSFDDCDLDFSTNPTLLTVLNKCCEDCGVAIGYGSFNNQNLTVNKKPEGVTYRQVVSYIAQIAGCNAKISDTGALVLRWYDTSVFADNWLDGGSFTAIGEEYKKYTISYDVSHEGWGYIIRYRRPDETGFLPRSGRYRFTKLYVYNISDPSNFDADYRIVQYNSVNYGVSRFNDTILVQNKLVEGDNIINYEFDISTLNRIIYWFGVVGNNYGDPDAATFDCDIYLEPVSYDDLDSADGGTFETEFQYYNATHWVYEGQSTSTGSWNFYNNITYQFLKPAGKYNITRTFVDNIADPTHFNAIWIVQKSVDSGSTWTDEATGNLVAGDNIINVDIDIPENIETRYRVAYRQNVSTDPDASDFDATLYMKADDVHYLDGDNFDGGDFATPLNYHNLISTNGTSVSTDDIQFTGVLVQDEDTSAHYPTYDGWDNYAMVISDNPFVAGYEDTIALYIYSQLQGLKFRPFTTSSIQDPTIEAGDCALVYDIKGNMYKTIITNVIFKTGGMTELSCNAEPPARQNSRYVNPAAQAVVKAEKKMNDYNAQVAHFNEIASQALGYYKTVEADTQTGAIITYLHDNPTLDTSTTVIKITADGIFISEDGGQSYNSGFDTSTGTMLLNLIYVHGLTSDWIRTGELDVGGLNNEDGVIRVTNRMDMIRDGSATIDGTDVSKWLYIGPSQINVSGTYRVFYNISDVEAGKDEVIKCQIQKRDKWDGSIYTYKVIVDYFNINDHYGEYPIRFDVDVTNGDMYYAISFSRVDVNNAGFTVTNTYNKVNTLIDKSGIDTNNINITGGGININNNFIVDLRGNMTAKAGTFNGSVYIQSGSDIVNISGGRLKTQGTWIQLCKNLSDVDEEHFALGYHYSAYMNDDESFFLQVRSKKIIQAADDYSDERLKLDIEPINDEYVRELILNADIKQFKRTYEPRKLRFGVIAQNVREQLDSLGIDKKRIELTDEDDEGFFEIDYKEYIPMLIRTVQNQQAEIDDLKKRIEALETLVNTNK